MITILHIHSENLGVFRGFLEEVLWHGLLDTLKLLPFLFLTYLLMEFIEHKGKDRVSAFMRGAGPFTPFVGAGLGLVPQCGFSVSAASLYTGRVISFGTLLAVFLSTSDEMIPILIAGDIPVSLLAMILVYKMLVAVIIGYLSELIFKIFKIRKPEINIDEFCEEDGCGCEGGIVRSSLHHTLSISLFILVITLALNSIIFFIGEDKISSVASATPFLSHAICTLLGLIPNCASSVLLCTLYTDGIITAGAMISGLFAGVGVGLLVLFRINKHKAENLAMLLSLIVSGFIFGLIFDAITIL